MMSRQFDQWKQVFTGCYMVQRWNNLTQSLQKVDVSCTVLSANYKNNDVTTSTRMLYTE